MDEASYQRLFTEFEDSNSYLPFLMWVEEEHPALLEEARKWFDHEQRTFLGNEGIGDHNAEQLRTAEFTPDQLKATIDEVDELGEQFCYLMRYEPEKMSPGMRFRQWVARDYPQCRASVDRKLAADWLALRKRDELKRLGRPLSMKDYFEPKKL